MYEHCSSLVWNEIYFSFICQNTRIKSKHLFSWQCLKKGKPEDHTWGCGSLVSMCWLCCSCVLLLIPWLAALVSAQCLGRWGCPVSRSSTKAEQALLGACCLPAAVQGLLIPLGNGVCWARDPKRDRAHSAVPVRVCYTADWHKPNVSARLNIHLKASFSVSSLMLRKLLRWLFPPSHPHSVCYHFHY